MKRMVSVLAVLFLCVFLVSGCGKKSAEEMNTQEKTKNAPTELAAFNPYFYKADAKGMAPVLANKSYTSWIQLSLSENNRVYVELYLEESGKFTLLYYELQVGISDSTVLNEQKVKGDWKLNGDKILLSDVASFVVKTTNGVKEASISFVKDVQTIGLKGKQAPLTLETRVYSALE